MATSYMEYLKMKQDAERKRNTQISNIRRASIGGRMPSNSLLGACRVKSKSYMPNIMQNKGDWKSIEAYLKTCPDIRCAVCFKCGSSAGNLYDKNNTAYKISRSFTLQQVKDLVEEIRNINNG